MIEPAIEPKPINIDANSEDYYISPPICDPYYQDCPGRRHPNKEQYSKASVHAVTWTSLSLLAIPTILYNEILQTSPADSTWLDAWKSIMFFNASAFGSTFILGIVSLSEIFETASSLSIEHGLSNLMIPATVYGIYQIFEVAVAFESWQAFATLFAYSMYSLWALGTLMTEGTRAMYFLSNYQLKNDDWTLYPSIFYLLGWAEHNERYIQHYGYYDGYYY